MLFIEINEGTGSLADIERISRHIIEHKEVINQLDQDEIKNLSVILTPTLARDHNEDEKRAHWQSLLNDFSMVGSSGNILKFYRQAKTGQLYFGDQEGFDFIDALVAEQTGS